MARSWLLGPINPSLLSINNASFIHILRKFCRKAPHTHILPITRPLSQFVLLLSVLQTSTSSVITHSSSQSYYPRILESKSMQYRWLWRQDPPSLEKFACLVKALAFLSLNRTGDMAVGRQSKRSGYVMFNQYVWAPWCEVPISPQPPMTSAAIAFFGGYAADSCNWLRFWQNFPWGA